MKFDELLHQVGDEPLFESSVLLAGDVNPNSLRRQLSRWTKAGKLEQLRRGLYALSKPYRKAEPHPFLIANALVRPSYVSLQSALRYHGLIPEHVPVTTSVTTGRPGEYDTAFGTYAFRHIDTSYFWGYETVELATQQAFVAMPEKALLDLVYLQTAGDEPAFLESLRLQNSEALRMDVVDEMVERWGKPKLQRAAESIREITAADRSWSEL